MQRRSESRSNYDAGFNQHSNSSSDHDNNNKAKEVCPDNQTQSRQSRQSTRQSFIQQRRQGKRSILFLHTFLLILIGPYILASFEDIFVHGLGYQHIHSSRSAAFFGGVNAMALPRSSGSNRSAKRQQSIFKIDRQSTREGIAQLDAGNGSTTTVNSKHEQSNQSVKVVDVPSQRWGHSVTYLANSNIALFVGGQLTSDDNSTVLTSDVYAYDLSVNATSPWYQLSSKNLAPHAFAARALTHDAEGSDERVFLVGGATDDCSVNASQMFIWKAGKSWKDGQWSATSPSNDGDAVPQRRRGARALQVPVQIGLQHEGARQAAKMGGISFMLMGGVSDETTCSNSSMSHSDVNIYTLGAGAGNGRKAKKLEAASTLDLRSMSLSPEMSNMSFVDYSAVYLPPNGTQSDRVLIMGGLNANGDFTPFNQLWSLDLTSGMWSQMLTTNSTPTGLDIPLGRVGHTATRTENGTIIIYGGYTSLDQDRVPTSDVHVLDYTVEPAVWSRVNSSNAPSRAYHTAFMTGQVMVVGFGQGNYSTSSINPRLSSLQQRSVSNSSTEPIQFLNMANGWTWTDSMKTLSTTSPLTSAAPMSSSTLSSTSTSASSASTSTASATSIQQSKATSSSASVSSSSPMSSSVASSSLVPASTPGSSSDANSSDNSSTSAGKASQASIPPAASTTAGTQPTTSTTSNGSGITPTQRKTAVLASVLGAAAVAALLGGLYAAHKRREARLNGDDDSLSGDKYERFSSSAPGPPVSGLWLHQLKRRATYASGALMNRGRSFRSRQTTSPRSGAGTAGISPRSFMANSYSTPMQGTGFRVMQNMAPTSRFNVRKSQAIQQEAIREKLQRQEMADAALPEDFLNSILDDDEVRSRNDLRRIIGGSDIVAPPPRVVMMHRPLSCDSLESDGGISHFSYPYLDAMNRYTSAGNSLSSEESSPTSLFREKMQDSMDSPGFLVQQEGIDTRNGLNMMQKRSSCDSLENDSEEEEVPRGIASRYTMSPSALVAAATALSSPHFPWELPSSSPLMPPRVLQGQKRGQESTLRVINNIGF